MEAVTVVARFRGAESGMDDFGEWTLTENSIKHNEKHHEFNFDAVLNPSKTQAELYEAAGRKIISFFCDGYNATIFAYGQSGSGKTFSMLGPEEVTEILVNKSEAIPPEVEEMFGILPRATFHIFESMKEGQDKGTKYEVRVSYIEVYNEMINDILACPTNTNLKLREFPNQGMCVIGMLENVANTPEAVFEAISAGTANRIVCSTGQNARSSRSHTVFIISMDQVLLDGTVKKSKINLVDLAGSEKLSKTGAQGQALKEAQKINLSLTTLGRCIKALTSGGGEHVPYRESKLTLILKESLSGSAMTTLIVTGSMRKVHQEETIGTMQFAERAKQVKTSAKSNSKKSYEELERLVNKLTEEVKLLQKGIVSAGGGEAEAGVQAIPAAVSEFKSVEYEELKIRYETLEEASVRQIEELRHALERAESKMGNIDYLAIHEEMESFRERIQEGEEQCGKLLGEKEAQRIEFENKIEAIKSNSEGLGIKLAHANSELQTSNRSLISAKQELSAKDSQVFKLNQEVQNFVAMEEKFREQILELEAEVKYEAKKKAEIEREVADLRKSLSDTNEERRKAEGVMERLEAESQELVQKIALLEKNELGYTEEIQRLRQDCDVSKMELSKLRLEIERDENESKLKEIEFSRARDEIVSEKQLLEQELSKLKEELEGIQKGTSESSIEEEKEKYAQGVTKVYKEQLGRLKEEKSQLINHIQELSMQLEKNKESNANYLKENTEMKEKIRELEQRYQKMLKELDDERLTKTRLYKSLKTVEDSQEIAIIEAENRVKSEMQLRILAFVQQDSEMREEMNKRDSQLKKYKETSSAELEKLRTELNTIKQQKYDCEMEIKGLQSELSLKIEQFFDEKKLLQSTVTERNSEIHNLNQILSEQETKINQSAVHIAKLESDVKQKTSERDTERKNSIIRQTLVPKRGSIFNKASAVAVQPQEKGKLPAFILRKTDNKFLNDAIKEAEEISKSSPNNIFKVEYEFQAIKALYANIDDYVSVRKTGDIQEVSDEDDA